MAFSKQSVFPIIRAHSVQPNRTRELGITLVTPGLLRLRFNNPPRHNSTDRYKAARMMRHIADNYVEELGNAAEVLKKVNGKNDLIAQNLQDVARVHTIHVSLHKLLESLKRTRAPTKLLAIERLGDAVAVLPKLNESTNPLGVERIGDLVYGEITKFGERYGNWRKSEISRILEAVSKREATLIPLRDEYLFTVVQLWADVLSNGNNFVMRNLWIRDVNTQKKIFSVLDEQFNIDELTTLGMSLRDTYNVTHLRTAFRLFNVGKMEEGKTHVREFALALGTRNPYYVIPEVREDIELAAAIMLEEGLIAIKSGKFYKAKREFESALRVLPDPKL